MRRASILKTAAVAAKASLLGLNEGITDFEMAIYNRYGERVFFAEDGTAGWDGTFNGKPQPMTYSPCGWLRIKWCLSYDTSRAQLNNLLISFMTYVA